MHARFFVPGPYAPGDLVDVPDEEARHLTRVLRLVAGDAVRLFDGRGHEFSAVIAEASKRTARVRIAAPHPPAPEPRLAITVVQAVLKGDKMDDVVRDAVMIGAAAIQPIVTTRTEVTLTALQRGSRRERWQRVAVSSAKQCGRAVVPPVLDPVSLDTALAALRQLTLPEPGLLLVEPVVEPVAANAAGALTGTAMPTGRQATVLVGPEGGWTGEELDRAAPVCRLVTLGGRTLRADAMAIVALAALFTAWGEF